VMAGPEGRSNRGPPRGRPDYRQVIDGGGDQVVGGVVEAQQP